MTGQQAEVGVNNGVAFIDIDPATSLKLNFMLPRHRLKGGKRMQGFLLGSSQAGGPNFALFLEICKNFIEE